MPDSPDTSGALGSSGSSDTSGSADSLGSSDSPDTPELHGISAKPPAVAARALPSTTAAVLLGFDYGEKRIGVAIANTLTRSARPLGIIENRNRLYRFEAIGELIMAWQPTQLVVGLPLYPDGTPHEMTQLAQRFGNQLNGRFNLPVAWADERYSSVEARATHAASAGRARSVGGKAANKRAAIDDEAARLILQQYLDDYVHA